MTRHLRLTRDSWRLLVIGVLLSLGQAALLVPIPLVVRYVFDSDLHRGRTGDVVLGGVVVLALYLGGSGLTLASRYVVLTATKRAIADLRNQLSTQLYALPKSFHDATDPRELHAAIVQGSERLDVFGNGVIGQMLPAAVVSLGLAVVALVLNPLLFALLACSVPAMVVVKRRVGSRVQARTRAWQQAFDRYSALTQTTLRARTLAEVRGADQIELARLNETVEGLSEAGLEMAWRQAGLSVAHGTIAAVAAVLVLVVGGIAVADGAMTTGDLISFYALVALLRGQVMTITALLPMAISGREALHRLNSFLDIAERAPYRGTRRIDFRGAIELRGVSFGYGRELVLHELDLEITHGEHLVILGPNGAGKSSLASLILGLYRPTSGELLAEGVPYDQLDMRDLRTTFGVLLQDPVMLPGTVAQNIAYGRPGASWPEIERAAVLAGANDFAQRLPEGYDSEVGVEGVLLSGGQRQRVALARALLGQPRLLILDEPTTHLDIDAIAGVRAALSDLTNRPTVITITHDAALASHADRVIHVREGRITPTTLATISGTAA